ncbi:hypothetical protein [Metamycoplasma buccale]|uniref:hypothetical protein n=1 Tax=Metamycoplasma buccale TaxID=55602 RepID=UPI00398E74A8
MTNFNYFETIKNQIKKNKLSQVYLFCGLPNINFSRYVIHFINSVNNENFSKEVELNNKENYFLIDGKNSIISKELIISAIKKLTESSLENKNNKKILLIKNIENGTQFTLNALLKFLENPPKDTIVIMTTNNKNNVLKTIKSRAFLININFENFGNILTEKYDEFFNLFNDDKLFQYLNKEEASDILDNLLKNIILFPQKPLDFLIYLNKLINKENANLVMFFIYIFFQEAYLFRNEAKNSYILFDKKYISIFSKFNDLVELIKIINDFRNTLNTNDNLQLQKASFIAKIGEYCGI